MASQAQVTKFAEFRSHVLADRCGALIKAAISAAGLSSDDCGKTWGVTVCPDKDSLVRLNVGNVAQLSVSRNPEAKDPADRSIHFIRIAVVDGELGLRGAPRGLRVLTGFPKFVDESKILVGTFEEWAESIFGVNRIARAFAAHADAAARKLPNANWHNPLAEALIA